MHELLCDDPSQIAAIYMRVTYDISMLGLGHYHLSRAGIFRVVEEIARGLAKADACELTFCATVSLDLNSKSADYLAASEEFRNVLFVSQPKRAAVYRNLGDRLTEINSKKRATVPDRILRRIILKSLKLIETSSYFLPTAELGRSEIFHSPHHSIPPAIYRQNHIKRFITIYDLIPVLFPQFFQFKGEHMIKAVIDGIRRDDWIICISESTKRDLCGYRKDLDPSRVFVTPLAASDWFYPEDDLEKISLLKRRYGIPDKAYFLSLSTLEPRKNIAQTIRCFGRLIVQEKLKDACLVLVGAKGWDYEDIFHELKNDELKSRVIITGFIPDEDLAPLYSGAVAFVYPSFYEGFGLPPLEAMKCGIPVITSNTSSLPEVVGDSGMMVAPDDADALCQNMLDLYQSASLRSELAAKSLAKSAQFSWTKTTAETIEAYQVAAKA